MNAAQPELPLPGGWPLNYSPDPTDKLRQLRQDKLDAKHEIRQVLDKYAERYGVRPLAVSDLVQSYVDDMLADIFDDREEEIRLGVQWAAGREELP
jgi:hypothetical protein